MRRTAAQRESSSLARALSQPVDTPTTTTTTSALASCPSHFNGFTSLACVVPELSLNSSMRFYANYVGNFLIMPHNLYECEGKRGSQLQQQQQV